MQETPYLVFPNNLEGLLKAGFYRDQILRFWNLDSSEEDKLNFKAETRDSHLHEYSGLYSKLPAHIDNLISVVKSSDVSALVEWVLKSATEFDAAINVTAREMPKICTLISEEAANLKNKLLKSKMGNIVPRYLKRRFSLFDSRTVAKVSKENKDVWMKDGGIRILLIHTGKVPKNWEALSRMLKGKAVLGHMVDESQSDNAPRLEICLDNSVSQDPEVISAIDNNKVLLSNKVLLGIVNRIQVKTGVIFPFVEADTLRQLENIVQIKMTF